MTELHYCMQGSCKVIHAMKLWRARGSLPASERVGYVALVFAVHTQSAATFAQASSAMDSVMAAPAGTRPKSAAVGPRSESASSAQPRESHQAEPQRLGTGEPTTSGQAPGGHQAERLPAPLVKSGPTGARPKSVAKPRAQYAPWVSSTRPSETPFFRMARRVDKDGGPSRRKKVTRCPRTPS